VAAYKRTEAESMTLIKKDRERSDRRIVKNHVCAPMCRCPVSLEPYEKSVIWQNTEEEFVANHTFSVSSAGIFYLGQADMAIHLLHYQ
jgi:hypothetical protein